MVKGIIVGHGVFAEAILKSAEQIVGKQQQINVVSNKGLSADMLIEKIKKAIGPDKGRDTMVFVDLPGGSCTISCYNLLKNMDDLNIICGVNLPILLEFFMLREKYSAHELVPILIKKGKENIYKLEQRK
jgi:mannose/fructose-specific phosphotransferase system component IIA